MLNSSQLLSTSSGFEFLKMFSCFFSLFISRYSFLRINKKNFLVKSWREKDENRPDMASGAKPFAGTWWIWVDRRSVQEASVLFEKFQVFIWTIRNCLEYLNHCQEFKTASQSLFAPSTQ
jgi:hypothetical protein